MNELLRIRRVVTKGLRSDVGIPGVRGSRTGVAIRLPAKEAVIAGGLGLPLQVPESDALLAMEILAGAYQLIADAGLDSARGARVNSRDLEFGGHDARKANQGRSQLPKKGVRRKSGFPRKGDVTNFKSGAGTDWLRSSWPRREAQELRGQTLLDGLHFPRGVQEFRGPLREDGCNWVVIFFGDEIIETRVNLREQEVERNLSPVVRVKMKPGAGRRRRVLGA